MDWWCDHRSRPGITYVVSKANCAPSCSLVSIFSCPSAFSHGMIQLEIFIRYQRQALGFLRLQSHESDTFLRYISPHSRFSLLRVFWYQAQALTGDWESTINSMHPKSWSSGITEDHSCFRVGANKVSPFVMRRDKHRPLNFRVLWAPQRLVPSAHRPSPLSCLMLLASRWISFTREDSLKTVFLNLCFWGTSPKALNILPQSTSAIFFVHVAYQTKHFPLLFPKEFILRRDSFIILSRIY